MSDPRRLMTHGDEFERRMLAAGTADGPTKRSARRVAASLGLASAVGTTAAAAKVGGSLVPGATASAMGTSVVIKWAGLAAFGLITAGGTAALVVRTHGSRPVPAESAPTFAVPPPGAVLAPEPSPSVQEPPQAAVAKEGDPVPPAAPAPALPPPKAAASPRSTLAAFPPSTPTGGEGDPTPPGRAVAEPRRAVSASNLTAETAALDAARSAIRAQQPARAIRALDSYDSAFPLGILAPEAMLLRIEASVSMGDRAGAERLGAAFLRAQPNSPLVPQVRALVPSLSNP